MDEKTNFRDWSTPTHEVPNKIDVALKWLELTHGRAQEYVKLCSEFSQGARSREHFLAYDEVCSLLDIYYAWKDNVAAFPDIRDRIRLVFKKGPLLSDDENADSATHKPRSTAFEFLLSGKLLHLSNLKVLSVDGIPNLTYKNTPIDP
jgi:hypothetical protein